ncbi:pentapeptide repeat-containing protein [Niveispirillum sp. KHB5.9]|uniref:pentapeptide repeat-containing protein n=1 Tax=Niveispirillum sp. KHB5.9 TaxID=3400269 RepID=UPI003A8B5167
MTEHAPPIRDLDFLRKEFQLHRQWLDGKGGRRAELQFQDLSGLALKGARLAEAKLAGANLSGCNLEGADLARVDLFGADLEGTELTGANLSGADLRGANLHRATLNDVILRGADFRSGTLSDSSGTTKRDGAAVLTEARLERAILCSAKLTGCDLTGADLMDADLAGADLSKCVMLGVDLTGANLSGAQLAGTVVDSETLSRGRHVPDGTATMIAEPPRRRIPVAELTRLVDGHEQWIETGGAKGNRLDLDMAELDPMVLHGRNLAGARLRRCRLISADWADNRLEMADLSYSDLSQAVLDGSVLAGATLRRANLSGAHLAGVDLTAQTLSGGRTWPANLDGANLRGADLTNATLSGAILRKADLAGAITTGVNMRGADLAGATRATDGDARQRRRLRRFVHPALAVGSRKGTARTRNWSFGGMALDADPAQYNEGELVTLLVAAPGGGEPVPVQARVMGLDGGTRSVSLKFEPLTPELKTYLNGLVAPRYRLG